MKSQSAVRKIQNAIFTLKTSIRKIPKATLKNQSPIPKFQNNTMKLQNRIRKTPNATLKKMTFFTVIYTIFNILPLNFEK
ncbi:Hypothetical protein IALB_0574 [Ignavibacterium album JCM 16511]|uniref:Uncharacterized protein n=1 Tax=Ignavibacterium album (strain DSM 19864 / JCM 16511 / NBRC 101810 / Mat9-16) TaxID=945713 RepID=I0AH29_IGNAJ|nr:Hypothetical protein IALB_0574 [Ignavibacterium album JCM 16511]